MFVQGAFKPLRANLIGAIANVSSPPAIILSPLRAWNIKRQCGCADFDAVEIYPRDRDVVEVANIRHVWILREPLSFAGRSTS